MGEEAYSNRSPRWLLTLNSRAWLSVVPRKSVPGVVPAFPDKLQVVPPPPLAAEIVSELPLGVRVTFAPAVKVTLSLKPFTDFTTWPDAILPAVIALFWMLGPVTELAAVAS